MRLRFDKIRARTLRGVVSRDWVTAANRACMPHRPADRRCGWRCMFAELIALRYIEVFKKVRAPGTQRSAFVVNMGGGRLTRYKPRSLACARGGRPRALPFVGVPATRRRFAALWRPRWCRVNVVLLRRDGLRMLTRAVTWTPSATPATVCHALSRARAREVGAY